MIVRITTCRCIAISCDCCFCLLGHTCSASFHMWKPPSHLTTSWHSPTTFYAYMQHVRVDCQQSERSQTVMFVRWRSRLTQTSVWNIWCSCKLDHLPKSSPNPWLASTKSHGSSMRTASICQIHATDNVFSRRCTTDIGLHNQHTELNALDIPVLHSQYMTGTWSCPYPESL